jgi:exopolysaccharide biosynthesis polyprenyl glycosylphosphotransferase
MIRLRHKFLIQGFRIFDQLAMVGVFVLLVGWIEARGNFGFIRKVLEKSYEGYEGLAMVGVLLGWFFIFNKLVHYHANRFTTLKSQAIEIAKAMTVTSLLLLLVGAMFYIQMVTPLIVSLFLLSSTALLIGSRVVVRALLRTLRRSGRNARHLLIIGETAKAFDLADRIESRRELGYEIEGFLFEDDGGGAGHLGRIEARWKVLGPVAGLRHLLKKGVIDEVMFCLPLRDNFPLACDVVGLCNDLGVVVRLVPELGNVQMLSQAQVEDFEGDQMVTFFRENLLFQLFAKRLMDLFGSAVLLVLLSPLLLVTAAAVKFTSPGPVFFGQERIGMNKRRFRLLKFRSMVVDAEERKKALAHLNEMNGPAFKIRKDPRTTPVGAILRKLSIDELPQLINVLKGEMSLVGPRPPLLSEVDLYDWRDRRRLSIKPGITCLWQISGRNELTFEDWMILDCKYIDNWSVWLDLKILLMTIPVVIFGKGAS